MPTSLAHGFAVAFSPIILLMCLIGALVGTLVGVLPGIGPLATIAMLLPITFGLPPVGALIMLAGIYYGAQYGGSTTAILVNIPGEASSVVTALDGHQMAQQGRAGAGAGDRRASARSSPAAFATVLIAPSRRAAHQARAGVRPGRVFLADGARPDRSRSCWRTGSVLKAIAMILLGLLLAMVGTDIETGASRMTFGIPELADGIGFVDARDGRVRLRRDHRATSMPAARPSTIWCSSKISGLMPTAQGPEGVGRRDPARHAARLDPRHPARRRRASSRRSRPTRSRRRSPRTRRASARARSRASPGRRAPTTRRRRPRSFRC